MPIINYEEGERENANGHVKRDGFLSNTNCTDLTNGVDGETEKHSCDSGDSCSSLLTTDSSGLKDGLVVSEELGGLQEELKWLGLWEFAGAVMYVLREVMGLDEKRMICAPDERRGRLLLEEIMAGGNFGHYDERNHFGQGALWHNIQRFRRDWRMLRFYPSEALSEPLFRVCHFLWRWKQKHTGKPKERNRN